MREEVPHGRPGMFTGFDPGHLVTDPSPTFPDPRVTSRTDLLDHLLSSLCPWSAPFHPPIPVTQSRQGGQTGEPRPSRLEP